MSKARYVTGLRAVEQLLANKSAAVQRIFAEYQSVNPRVEALISEANNRGIEIQPANRARLQQISGEARHQGIVAEVRRSTMLDEAGLRTLVEDRLGNLGHQLLLLMLGAYPTVLPKNSFARRRGTDRTRIERKREL
jgi:23S rRNA (guanosine2251-2'-O)-methyltransferase